MARPLWHTIAALVPAYLATAAHGRLAGAATLAGAIAVDGDHLVDWVCNGGREDYTRRIIVPAHGWEFVVGAIIAARTGTLPALWRAPAVGFGAGLACHLVLDHLLNRPGTIFGYIFLWRLWNGFDRQRCGWLAPAEWIARHRTSQRAAPLETVLAALMGIALLQFLPRARTD